MNHAVNGAVDVVDANALEPNAADNRRSRAECPPGTGVAYRDRRQIEMPVAGTLPCLSGVGGRIESGGDSR